MRASCSKSIPLETGQPAEEREGWREGGIEEGKEGERSREKRRERGRGRLLYLPR